MTTKFSDIMAKRTDAELVRIVTALRDDYQTEAVEAAEAELASRDISPEQLASIKQQNEIVLAGLNPKIKRLAFIFPGVTYLLLAKKFKKNGSDKKLQELANFSLFGFGTYSALAVIIIALNRIFDLI